MFIFAIILGIIAIVCLGVRKIEYDGGPSSGGGTFPMWIVGLVFLFFAVIFGLFGCFYKLSAGQAAVVTSFTGKIDGTSSTTGAHFKAPWEKVTKYDLKNQIVTFAANGQGKNLDDIAITAQTSDNASAKIDISVRYSLDPNKIRSIFTNFHSEDALRQRAIMVAIRSVSRDAPATFPAASLRQNRPKLTADITKELSTKLETFGVIVDSVDIRGITFDDTIENSLSAVQQALAAVQTARAQLSTAQIQAEVTKTDAQAQSDSDQIIRCGATSELTTKTVNGQDVSDIKVTPIPQDKCQNRLNEQVLTSKYIDMLKLAAQKGDTIYVVPPGSSNLLNLPAPAGSAAPAASTK
jgi:regulator of protease activity HflC (stomatin/prohibitin superfamily)